MDAKKRTPGAPKDDNGSSRTEQPQGQQRPSRAPDTAYHHRHQDHFHGTPQQQNGGTDRPGNDFLLQQHRANASEGQEATRQDRVSHQDNETALTGGQCHSMPKETSACHSDADSAMQTQDSGPSTGHGNESRYEADDEGDTIVGNLDEEARQYELGKENAVVQGKMKQPACKAIRATKKPKDSKNGKAKKRRTPKKEENKNNHGHPDESEDGDAKDEEDDDGSESSGGCRGPGGPGGPDDGGGGSGGAAVCPLISGRLPNHQRPGGPKAKKPNPRPRHQKARSTPQAIPPSGPSPSKQYPPVMLLQGFPHTHEHGLLLHLMSQLLILGIWDVADEDIRPGLRNPATTPSWAHALSWAGSLWPTRLLGPDMSRLTFRVENPPIMATQ
jgi:hypothetical protein